MKYRIIAALSLNDVYANAERTGLPWPPCREDMRHFGRETEGGTVIMGRKTVASLPGELKNRHVIMVSKSNVEDLNTEHWRASAICRGIDIAIRKASARCRDVWFAGGYEIFKAGLVVAEEMLITRIPLVIPGKDLRRFPRIRPTIWRLESTSSLLEGSRDKIVYQTGREALDVNVERWVRR